MKIAIVAEPFQTVPPKKYGGTERVIYDEIKGLNELGHEVILLAPNDSQVDCELIPIWDKHIDVGKKADSLKQVRYLNRKVRERTFEILDKIKGDVDIIHSHGIDLSRYVNDVPCVTTIHNVIVLKQMEYYNNRKHMSWITVSKNQQEPYPSLDYVDVVYNGLDPAVFEFKKDPDDYICFIGRIDRQKNPSEAIELALALDLKIKLAGRLDFQGSSYFKEEIKPYFNNPKVEFLGEVGMKDKIELLKNAKCNMHTINFREPFGLTVIESAYCGTPTLAFNRGSMPELIEQNRTGMIVEDIHDAYFNLKKCFEMDREYVSERAKMLFNYKKMTNNYIVAFNKVISKFKKNKEEGNTYDAPNDNYTSNNSLFW